MTIEEKAKAYDEALEIAKGLYAKDAPDSLHLERMFPALAESEGEKIRKYLIKCVEENVFVKSFANNGFDKQTILAWLEKQGEHANFRNKIQIGDKVTRNRDGMLVNLSQLNRVAKKDENQKNQKPADKVEPKFKVGDEIKTKNEESLIITRIDRWGYWSEDLFICNFDDTDKWELVEQKPADTIETKFHEGDWVVTDKNNVVQIKAIENDKYVLENTMRFTVDYVDKCWRKWTIQDAKDGDVLSYRNGQWIFIYKEKIDDKSFYYHALYSTIQGLTIANVGFTLLSNAITPATKEQRDLLFQKMREADYEWDAEHKQLKKIEGESVWSEEDSVMINKLLAVVNLYYNRSGNDLDKQSCISWLKSLRPQNWTKEDKERYISCLQRLSTGNPEQSETINSKWFKEHVYPQSHWKPSNEQMVALQEAMNIIGILTITGSKINSLYQDLKKLREE